MIAIIDMTKERRREPIYPCQKTDWVCVCEYVWPTKRPKNKFKKIGTVTGRYTTEYKADVYYNEVTNQYKYRDAKVENVVDLTFKRLK